MKWIKAGERLPNENETIFWKGWDGRRGVGFDGEYFTGAEVESKNYSKIEWLDESEPKPESIPPEGDEFYKKMYEDMVEENQKLQHELGVLKMNKSLTPGDMVAAKEGVEIPKGYKSKEEYEDTLIWSAVVSALRVDKPDYEFLREHYKITKITELNKWKPVDYNNPPDGDVLIVTNSRVIRIADWYKISWRTESGNIHPDDVLFYQSLPEIPNKEIDKIQEGKVCKCTTEEERWSCTEKCANKPKIVRS